jgi:hypothetical protein
MSHLYVSRTYIAASARLDEACVWLASLGINYSPTRVGRYRKLFADLARHQLTDTLPTFYDKYSLASFINAAHEVAELVRMYEGLCQHRDTSLVSRLRNALRGHELFVMDDNDRSGRDFTLELSIAAKVAHAGLPVDFGHQADLRTHFAGYEFFVECKRLKSPKQVERRIKEGLAQLEQRYAATKQPTTARGILVLGTAKLVNSDLGVIEADDLQSLGEKAFAYNRAFIDTHSALWHAQIGSRTLGVAVVLDVPGVVGATRKLVTCHEVAMNNAVPINTPSYALLHEFSTHVFPRRTSPVSSLVDHSQT